MPSLCTSLHLRLCWFCDLLHWCRDCLFTCLLPHLHFYGALVICSRVCFFSQCGRRRDQSEFTCNILKRTTAGSRTSRFFCERPLLRIIQEKPCNTGPSMRVHFSDQSPLRTLSPVVEYIISISSFSLSFCLSVFFSLIFIPSLCVWDCGWKPNNNTWQMIRKNSYQVLFVCSLSG